MSPMRVLVLGAAGRDFHNFNVCYRDDPAIQVVAFTATQIPGIAGRRYPAALAGPRYPDGIPILAESELETVCRRHQVQQVVFAYSDVSHAHVMHLASRALACGADYVLLGPDRTMLRARVPVIAISAVRTGCGKSQVARWLGRRLREAGRRVAVLRHPMPYGDLAQQRVQCFATRADLDAAHCTAEEREEYEPHLAAGNVVLAGVDYRAVLERAESMADILVWDGGNNDFPFLRPDLHLVVTDALRSTQLADFHPGEAVLRMADVVVVNKVDAASAVAVREVIDGARALAPNAVLVRVASPVRLDDPAAVVGRRVVVVEDGPTITHGGMAYGAGYVAATAAGVAEIVDPRPTAAPALQAVYAAHPHIGRVVPAIGYRREHLEALRATIDRAAADVVVAATPLDLQALIGPRTPVVRARYDLAEVERPGLGDVVDRFLQGLTTSGADA